jgi:predicted DNA-binding protein (UPF0251 family)
MAQFTPGESRILDEIAFERFLLDHCDLREMLCLQMQLSGFTVTEIAQKQRVSRRYITRVFTRLREKINQFLVPK